MMEVAGVDPASARGPRQVIVPAALIQVLTAGALLNVIV
jgi:hypothetical protein